MPGRISPDRDYYDPVPRPSRPSAPANPIHTNPDLIKATTSVISINSDVAADAASAYADADAARNRGSADADKIEAILDRVQLDKVPKEVMHDIATKTREGDFDNAKNLAEPYSRELPDRETNNAQIRAGLAGRHNPD